MRTDRKRLLDDLPTPRACLRGVAGVHSDDLMSSTLSLGSENIEERAPGGVHDAFCEMMVFHHPIEVQVLDGNMLILFSILFGDLEMKVPPLALDLEMRLCRTLGSLTAAFTTDLSACKRALLTAERGLALAIVAWVLNSMSFRVRQERFQPNVNPDIGMFTHAWKMLLLTLGLADDESIPVPVSTQDQVSRLRSSFYRAMQLDFDRAAQLLGDGEVLAIGSQREIGLVLSQLNGMPPIRLFEAWEAHIRKTEFFGSEKAFEGLTQAIREHLYRRSRNVFPTTGKLFVQIVFRREGPILLVTFLERREHLVVDVTRLAQALHQQLGLCLIRIDSVLERFHTSHFIEDG